MNSSERNTERPGINDSALSWALAYAGMGIPVFPIRSGGKTPMTENGHNDATTDTDKISKWFTANPRANIGLAMGKAAGLMVIDHDGYADGSIGVSELEKKLCIDLASESLWEASTASGGTHYFLAWNGDRSRNGIFPGVDLKAEGGYVVATPSLAIPKQMEGVSGAAPSPYLWNEGGSPWDIPKSDLVTIKRLTEDPKPEPARIIDDGNEVPKVFTHSQYGASALTEICNDMAASGDGTRNDTLNKLSFAIGQLVRSGHLEPQAAQYSLRLAAEEAGLPTVEVIRTMASGYNKGLSTPRSNVPEVNGEPLKFVNENGEKGRKSMDLFLSGVREYLGDEYQGFTGDLNSILGDCHVSRYASDLSRQIQFPKNSTTMMIMWALSAACSAAFCVRYPDGSRLPIGLYTIVEGPAGSGKSRLLSAVTRTIRQEFRGINARRIEEVEKRKAEAGTELISTNKEEDSDDQEEEEHFEKVIFNAFQTDLTPEALDRDMGNQDGFMMLASAEQGLVASLMGGMYSKSGKSNNDIVLKAFNGEYHKSSRAKRTGNAFIAHGSLAVIAQQNTIDQVLEASGESGLVERFLMISEKTTLGKRRHTSDKRAINPFSEMNFENIVRGVMHRASEIPCPSIGQLNTIGLSPEGEDFIDEYRNWIEPRLASGEDYGEDVLRGMFAKADIHIRKVAACLHIARHMKITRANNDGDLRFTSEIEVSQIPSVVDEDIVPKAIEFVHVILSSTKDALTSKGHVGITSRVTRLIDYLERTRGNNPTITQVVSQIGRKPPFSKFKNRSESVREAINEAERLGLVTVSGKLIILS